MKLKLRAGLLLALLAFFALPQLASAHTPDLFGIPPGYWGPMVSCSGNPISAGTNDGSNQVNLQPCRTVCDFFHTVQHVTYFFLTLLLYVIAPIAVVVGGIMIMVSGGNPSLYTSGKNAIFGAAIGVAIGLGAFLIINTFMWIMFGKVEGDNRGQTNLAWPTLTCSVLDPAPYQVPRTTPPLGTRDRCELDCQPQPPKFCELRDTADPDSGYECKSSTP